MLRIWQVATVDDLILHGFLSPIPYCLSGQLPHYHHSAQCTAP